MTLVIAVTVVVVLMTFCAYAVLAERKISAWIQGRVGPNRTTLPIIGAIPVIGPFLPLQPRPKGGMSAQGLKKQIPSCPFESSETAINFDKFGFDSPVATMKLPHYKKTIS